MLTKHQTTDESLPVWTPGLGVMGQWRMGRTLVVRLMIFQSIDVPTLTFGPERRVVREPQGCICHSFCPWGGSDICRRASFVLLSGSGCFALEVFPAGRKIAEHGDTKHLCGEIVTKLIIRH